MCFKIDPRRRLYESVNPREWAARAPQLVSPRAVVEDAVNYLLRPGAPAQTVQVLVRAARDYLCNNSCENCGEDAMAELAYMVQNGVTPAGLCDWLRRAYPEIPPH